MRCVAVNRYLFCLAVILALLAGLALGLAVRGEDTTYRVKVVVVDRGQQVAEAKFIVLPDDLRIVCRGDAGKMFTGDYVKVEFHDQKFWIGKMECSQVKWVK